MVGVPGRSKGCNTCRKRRIACSLERPHCQQCIKSKRVCTGYQRDRVFVTSTTSSQEGGQQWRQAAYQAPPAEQAVQTSFRHRTGMVSVLTIAGLSSLEKTAVTQQTIGTVVDKYRSIIALEGDGSHWVSKIPGQFLSEALEASMLAFCAPRLGRAGAGAQDGRLERATTKLYGNALCAVRRAVGSPELAYNAETLVACWLLVMYEVFECPEKARTAYVQHFEGCAKLVELRGPEAHQEGMAHSVFLTFRTMAALEALVRHKTFLSKPDWRTIPFAKVVKSPFDLLIDIILDGPAIMVRAAQLEHVRSPQVLLLEATSILKSCNKVVADLHQLYSDTERSIPGPLYWSVFSTINKRLGPEPGRADASVGDLFPLQHEFVDIRIATTVALYWGVLVILYAAIDGLNKLVKPLQASIKDLDPPEAADVAAASSQAEANTDFLSPARNVCQSVQYCIQHDLGLPFIIAPLNMVIQTLKRRPGHEREVAWARRTLQLVKLGGVKIVDYLPQDDDSLI